MFFSYDAKEINTLILRYEAENGEVEVLETWVIKQQPKLAGPQIHIGPHPKSTQVHITVGGELAITESAMVGNAIWWAKF
ncbi:unnamed protein product [Caenorhabditis brenneri]